MEQYCEVNENLGRPINHDCVWALIWNYPGHSYCKCGSDLGSQCPNYCIINVFIPNGFLKYIIFQACARPLITVYSDKGEKSGKNVVMPAIFKAPIRPDIVNFVHTNLRKNNRQPYAVSADAGNLDNFCRLLLVRN